MTNKRIGLYDSQGQLVKDFKNMAEAGDYCEQNNICNRGWIRRSLNEGEKFYYPNGEASTNRTDYTGAGWYVKYI